MLFVHEHPGEGMTWILDTFLAMHMLMGVSKNQSFFFRGGVWIILYHEEKYILGSTRDPSIFPSWLMLDSSLRSVPEGEALNPKS